VTDASCGYLSLLPNLVRHFGWNPGDRIYTWFGQQIKAKTARDGKPGNADITFYEVRVKYHPSFGTG
jgi:arachidonate 5-lipoxygenase